MYTVISHFEKAIKSAKLEIFERDLCPMLIARRLMKTKKNARQIMHFLVNCYYCRYTFLQHLDHKMSTNTKY